jgi:hypothetical protein
MMRPDLPWITIPRERGQLLSGRGFADLHSITRSVTLDAPISATATLAEIAEELVRSALADHPEEKTISLLAISVSHLEKHWKERISRVGTFAVSSR